MKGYRFLFPAFLAILFLLAAHFSPTLAQLLCEEKIEVWTKNNGSPHTNNDYWVRTDAGAEHTFEDVERHAGYESPHVILEGTRIVDSEIIIGDPDGLSSFDPMESLVTVCPTPTPTSPPTQVPSSTPSATATTEPSPSPSPSPTDTSTATATTTPTPTATLMPTLTATPLPSPTGTWEPTATPWPTETPPPPDEATASPTPTAVPATDFVAPRSGGNEKMPVLAWVMIFNVVGGAVLLLVGLPIVLILRRRRRNRK